MCAAKKTPKGIPIPPKHPGGRPRTITPPKDYIIQLGEEYLEWLEEHPEAVHHTEFYSIEKRILRDQWDDICETQEFKGYYEQARNILAKRHMTGAVKEGIAHRFLRLYLKDLRDEENADKVFESNLRTKQAEAEALNLAKLSKQIQSGEIGQK